MPLTIAELMSKLPGSFLPEKAAGMDVAIQFNFSGTEAGDWYATIKEGRCAIAQGTVAAPKMTLKVDSTDFVKIFTGQMDAMAAFMQGKLKLAGDMNLGMKLMSMFKLN
jgi:putative sterol carrier protein